MEHETTRQVESCLPQPLTRRNADGQVYQRLAVVDRQIEEALGLNDEELRSRLAVRDEESPIYLKEESLAYLIRHHHAAGNRKCVNDLTECLLKRCATWINGKLRGLRTDLREDGYAAVVAEIFARMLDMASDRGDFLQVRFWKGIERITVDVFRKQIRQFDTESSGDYDQVTIDELTQQGAVVVPAASGDRNVASEAIDNVLIEAALNQLEEPIRSAYLLRHLEDWPIEDKDPAVQTISRHFGKTPRTIRNWLSKADEILEAWRGEQR
ncbi:MAG: hypothetical protein OXL97_14620 [Chloroflexota bacterium]|nr:hypothetical protein [Chloroflexota bacterium]MDE2886523.1 hypothetical protein [Chloroflexota bacterium]